MIKKILHGTKAVMIAALGLMLTACEYKDLGDFGRGKIKKIPVTLHFDWQQVDSIPNSMRVVFYLLVITTSDMWIFVSYFVHVANRHTYYTCSFLDTHVNRSIIWFVLQAM